MSTGPADPLAAIPPPSEDVIALTCVDLFFSAIFIPMGVYIAWKHGRTGKMTWPNLPITAVFKLVGDIYLLVIRDKPLIPRVLPGLVNAAVLSTITLTVAGILHLCNIILPMPPNRKVEKYLLIATHITNIVGISMAFARKQIVMILGNIIVLALLLALCVWMWPTYEKIQRYSVVGHPNAVPARKMFWAAVAAMPFWMVRLVHNLVSTITQQRELETTLGSFTVKFVIVFWMYLGAMVTLLVGGWLGIGWQTEIGTMVEYLGDQDERTFDGERRRISRRGRRMIMYGGGDATPEGIIEVATPMKMEVVQPKPSHATSMTMSTTRNSVLAPNSSNSRELRPKPSHASLTVVECDTHESSSFHPLRPRPSRANSTLAESTPDTTSSSDSPADAEPALGEPGANKRWPFYP